jgi:hypothetical protein
MIGKHYFFSPGSFLLPCNDYFYVLTSDCIKVCFLVLTFGVFIINIFKKLIETLNTIKSKLKIGRVTVESNRNRCAFIVEKHEDIKNIICPIFNTFPLHTSKRLDFEDFYKAFLIKDSASPLFFFVHLHVNVQKKIRGAGAAGHGGLAHVSPPRGQDSRGPA